MKYLLMFFLFLYAVTGPFLFPAAAENTHSIEGVVHFYKNFEITVLLLTKAELESMEQCSYRLKLQPDAAALSTGEMPFVMTNVAKGDYVLLAYQDLNHSKTLDKKYFAFSEPWGTFRPQRPGMGYHLNFEDLDFKLTRNVHNIAIRLTR